MYGGRKLKKICCVADDVEGQGGKTEFYITERRRDMEGSFDKGPFSF